MKKYFSENYAIENIVLSGFPLAFFLLAPESSLENSLEISLFMPATLFHRKHVSRDFYKNYSRDFFVQYSRHSSKDSYRKFSRDYLDNSSTNSFGYFFHKFLIYSSRDYFTHFFGIKRLRNTRYCFAFFKKH